MITDPFDNFISERITTFFFPYDDELFHKYAYANDDALIYFKEDASEFEKSVLQNVMTPLYFNKSISLGKMKKMALSAMEMVGISELKKKKVNLLSGGQKQRVGIARAIVANPKVILADEPTGALDSETANSILDLLIDLNRSGTTILIVTHDEDIAVRCSRIIKIADKILIEKTTHI